MKFSTAVKKKRKKLNIYLGNKIADHTTIIDAHSRPIGVENSGNPNLQQQQEEQQPMYVHLWSFT
jgi:hypothetical protein